MKAEWRGKIAGSPEGNLLCGEAWSEPETTAAFPYGLNLAEV